MRAMHGIYYEKHTFDPAAIGQNMLKLVQYSLNKAQQDLQETKQPCAHVIYNELVADPIATVKSIYKDFNYEYTAEYDKILKDYLEENRKQREAVKLKNAKHGKAGNSNSQSLHEHDPTEFSLTVDEISKANTDYTQTFKFKEIK